jgi:hypothetical protein
MPSIKYSALVSDMKGKSNGSVFSTNKQGAYFRNNRTGGGRKTKAWDKQKANFSFLSTTWKGLTYEQQQAWTNAAPIYPALNKFKVAYIPSGFQLYMKLNGVLLAKGKGLLTLPGVKREFPDTTGIILSDQKTSTFTPSLSGTFNFPDGAATNSNEPFCPQCYVQTSNKCEIIGSDNEFLNCWANAQTVFSVEDTTDCETDQDCKDAGLGTASADICCEDGCCVYCGDGLANQYQAGYLVPIGPTLTGGGVWDERTPKVEQSFSESFRINLAPSALSVLTIQQLPIVLVSCALGTGEGIRYKFEPINDRDCLFRILIGMKSPTSPVGDFTNVVDFIIPIDVISHGPCVVSLQGNYSLAEDWSIIFDLYSNFEPAYSNIPGWVAIADKNSTYAKATAGFNAGPFLTDEEWFLKVLGSGVEGRQQKISFGDYRYRLEYYAQTDRFYITQGGILPAEILVGIAEVAWGTCSENDYFCDPNNGTSNPGGFLQKSRCANNMTGGKNCSCRDGKCKKNQMGGLMNYGTKSLEVPTLAFIAPAYEFTNLAAKDYSLSFTGEWVPYQNFPVINNGAIFTPTLYLNTEQCTGDDFYCVVSCTKGKSNATLCGPWIYIGNFEMGLTYTVNLLPYIRAVIGNFIPNIWYTIKIETLDAANGMLVDSNFTSVVTSGLPGIVSMNSVRFKAGSDLSSSVN